jgi:hypothetical protein
MKFIIPFSLIGAAIAQECKGSSGGLAIMGYAQTGIFGCGSASAPPSMSLTGIIQMLGPVLGMGGDKSGGSGPHKASYNELPGLARHTVYQPSNVPPGVKLLVILWGNGACAGWGAWFSKFLNEIASHGYFIIANGGPNASVFTGTNRTDIPDAIEWVYKNAGTGAYANVDKTRLAVAGQSCGGVQAMSASLDPRVTLLGVFNSGLINTENTKLFDKFHTPIGYFLGGPTDIAYANVS